MPALHAKTASRSGKAVTKTRLNDNQSSLSSRLISQIYRAVFFPELWSSVLSETTALLGSTKALFISLDRKANARRVHHAHGVDSAFISAIEGEPAQEGAGGAKDSPIRPGEVVYGNHLLSPVTGSLPSVFGDVLKQEDVGPVLHACIGDFGEEQLHLVVARSSSGETFSEENRGDCQNVVDLIRDAWELERQVAEHHLIDKGAMAALNKLAVGVMMVDGKSQVLATNMAAQGLLDSGDGLDFDLGRIDVSEGGCRSSLKGCLTRSEWSQQTQGLDFPELLAVQRPSGRRPYSLLVYPFRPDDGPLSAEPACQMVFIFDPESSLCGYSVEFLRRFYDLTPAEARLAKLIAEGDRLDAIAERLNISVHTARTHLKRVFEKTGVERQAELVQLMFGCLGFMQDHPAHLGAQGLPSIEQVT